MLRAFYVSIHEVNALPDALHVLRQLDEEYSSCCGVRVGLLANWLRWRSMPGYLRVARELGLRVIVDNGGFQGATRQGDVVRLLAVWAVNHQRLYDYVLAPDVPVATCVDGSRLDLECAKRAVVETLELHRKFYSIIERRGLIGKVLPVLQGWDAESYAEFYDRVSEILGWRSGYVALGSAKLWQKRSRDRERRGRLKQLIEQLSRQLKGVRLHLLGIHGEQLHHVYYYDVVYSADSGSQGLNYRYKWRTVLKCTEFSPECYQRSIEYEVRLTLKPLLNRQLLATGEG